jgi:hypothetical protein
LALTRTNAFAASQFLETCSLYHSVPHDPINNCSEPQTVLGENKKNCSRRAVALSLMMR